MLGSPKRAGLDQSDLAHLKKSKKHGASVSIIMENAKKQDSMLKHGNSDNSFTSSK